MKEIGAISAHIVLSLLQYLVRKEHVPSRATGMLLQSLQEENLCHPEFQGGFA